MARVSKGAVGKASASLPLLALASAAWVVLLAGLAIAEAHGTLRSSSGFLNARSAGLLRLRAKCQLICDVRDQLGAFCRC